MASAISPDGLNLRNNWDVTGFVRLGYRVAPHLRLEVEGGYWPSGSLESANDLITGVPGGRSLCGGGGGGGGGGATDCSHPGGSLNSYTLMVSGSAAYNQPLSERRAKATANGLVSLGIAQTSLDVS